MEYMEKLSRCTSLRILHIPIRYPGTDIVRPPTRCTDNIESPSLQAAIIKPLLPMFSLRVLCLSLLDSTGNLRITTKQLFETIEGLRFTTPFVPQFQITGGPWFDPTVFQWEFEREGRMVGRFRQLGKLSLLWSSSYM